MINKTIGSMNNDVTPSINGASSGKSQNWAKGNNFYIFDEIDDEFPSSIIVPFINELERQLGQKHPGDMNIYITSPGGYVKYAFDLIAHIEYAKQLGVGVNTIVTSEACSGGSLIAVTGSRRYIGDRAYHLLHFARGWSYAHNPEMEKRNQQQGAFWQKKLVEIYEKYTKIKDIEKKLLADNFMVNGYKDCIKLGIADEKY